MISLSKSKYCGLWQCPKIAWLRKFKPEEYTVDVSARAVVGGVGKNLNFSGMSLASLMEKASK